MTEVTGLKKRKVSLAGPLIAVVWCLAAATLVYLFPQICGGLNYKLYDWKMALSETPERAHEVVHVDVDDSALKKYGMWPWDRAMSGKIVDRLTKLGAKAIAFDVL